MERRTGPGPRVPRVPGWLAGAGHRERASAPIAADGRFSIDDAYAGEPGATPLPAADELAAIGGRLRALIAGSLEAWGLAGTDLDTVSFDADDTGVDRFLGENPIRIDDARITVVVTDPDDATQTRAVPVHGVDTGPWPVGAISRASAPRSAAVAS